MLPIIRVSTSCGQSAVFVACLTVEAAISLYYQSDMRHGVSNLRTALPSRLMLNLSFEIAGRVMYIHAWPPMQAREF
jgi:hypothetical protein